MSFLKKLFGGGSDASGDGEAARTDKPAKTIEYNGYTIHATPYVEAGQHQLCGIIEKVVGAETKTHKFIRADRFASRDDAVEMTLMKARQIIDQQGDRIFA